MTLIVKQRDPAHDHLPARGNHDAMADLDGGRLQGRGILVLAGSGVRAAAVKAASSSGN
jgi:hypothetical protein